MTSRLPFSRIHGNVGVSGGTEHRSSTSWCSGTNSRRQMCRKGPDGEEAEAAAEEGGSDPDRARTARQRRRRKGRIDTSLREEERKVEKKTTTILERRKGRRMDAVSSTEIEMSSSRERKTFFRPRNRLPNGNGKTRRTEREKLFGSIVFIAICGKLKSPK